MSFPFTAAFPAYVYDVVPANPETPDAFRDRRDGWSAGESLRDALAAETEKAKESDLPSGYLRQSRIPRDLGTKNEIIWQWSWADGEGPVDVGVWLSWIIRYWKKTPPKRLIDAMVDERVDVWKVDNKAEVCPPAEKEAIEDAVHDELMKRTVPELYEFPVLFDTEHRRLLFVCGTPSRRKWATLVLKPVLEHMLGAPPEIHEWTLERYLAQSRPQAILPSEVPERWLAWLTDHAMAGRWAVVTTEGQEAQVFRVVLDDNLDAEINGATIHASGATACEKTVGWLQEDGDLRIAAMALKIEPATVRGFEIRLDAAGRLGSVKLVDATKYKKDIDELDPATLDRACALMEAAQTVRTLMQAFDAAELSRLMEERPQQQLFGGSVPHNVSWFDVQPTVTETKRAPKVNAEEKPKAQANLFRRRGRGDVPPAADDHQPGPTLPPIDEETLRAETRRIWNEVGELGAMSHYRKARGLSLHDVYDVVREICGAADVTPSPEDLLLKLRERWDAGEHRDAVQFCAQVHRVSVTKAAQLVADLLDEVVTAQDCGLLKEGDEATQPPWLPVAFEAMIVKLARENEKMAAYTLYRGRVKVKNAGQVKKDVERLVDRAPVANSGAMADESEHVQ